MSTLSLDGTLAKRPWNSTEDESPVSRPRSPLYNAAASSPPERGPTAPKRARLSSPGPLTSTHLDGSGDEEDACSEACCGGTKAASGEEGGVTSAGGSSSVDKAEDETDHQPPSNEDETNEQRIERLVDDLESELCCPICSAVLYKPVTIQPGCGHAFCGACLYGYLRASSPSPHVCPSCRSTATSASHSRIVSSLVDVLIAHAPDRARTENEKDQADDIWQIGMPLRFGNPPPPPERIRLSECYRPCRHCSASNPYGWTCPLPVPSIDSDGPHYPLDGPTPPGHFQCASCARLSASEAPATTSCSICEAHYCGSPGHAGETGVCSPEMFVTSKPGESLWGRSAYDLADAILDGQSDELMNAFRDNLEEMAIFARFVTAHPEHTAGALWVEIRDWILSDEGQLKGGVKGVFRRTDDGIHYGLQSDAPIVRTCKSCVDDIFACGLYEWWERKRPTVLSQLEKEVQTRINCKNGHSCYRQGNLEHSRKFNHVCAAAPPEIIDSIVQDDSPMASIASSSNSSSLNLAEASGSQGPPVAPLSETAPTSSSSPAPHVNVSSPAASSVVVSDQVELLPSSDPAEQLRNDAVAGPSSDHEHEDDHDRTFVGEGGDPFKMDEDERARETVVA